MWYLESPKGEVYSITPGRVHTVSRKHGDIVLANDQSVSRKHAHLEVLSPITNGVSVWDGPSKYGTFVNDDIAGDTKLLSGFRATLTEGAKVRFGLQDMNIWTLKKEKLCACAHFLTPTEKSRVKALLNQMGHDLVDSWTKEATHLTTNYLRLTNEVMCALASAKPIVLPEFWHAYSRMMTGKDPVPEPANFMPPLEDSKFLKTRISCLPNQARKTLFVDKQFVFSSTQSYKSFKIVIEAAGGKALELSQCRWPLDDFCKPNVIVLSCEEKNQTPLYNKVLSTLLDKNLRIIPVDDIGLALWKTTTTVHCNPAHSANSILRRPDDIQQDTGATLVINTEDDAIATGVDIDDQLVIPPTLSESHLSSEDATMSMSIRATEKTSPAGPSRKRTRENSGGRGTNVSPKTSPKIVPVKKEPEEEEEDMFAFEDPMPSSSSKRFKNGFGDSVPKEKNKPLDLDDGFLFSSPPKKKKVKPPVDDEEADMFELPREPSPQKSNSNKNDEDECDFLSTSKLSRSMKATKPNPLEESKDMFETQDLPSPACSSSRGEKRKDRGHSEPESPPLKKPTRACLDVTNVHNSSKPSTSLVGFISKHTNSHIKQEIKREPDVETDLAERLCAKVVITSLLRKPRVDDHNNTSANTSGQSGKNFKKFKKVWSGSTTRQHITTSRVRSRSFNGHTLNSTGREEEEEDDPFLPTRPAAGGGGGAGAPRHNGHRNNIHDHDDDDDEFALPTFSQCM